MKKAVSFVGPFFALLLHLGPPISAKSTLRLLQLRWAPPPPSFPSFVSFTITGIGIYLFDIDIAYYIVG